MEPYLWDKELLSRRLGAQFLRHQVAQLEKSVEGISVDGTGPSRKDGHRKGSRRGEHTNTTSPQKQGARRLWEPGQPSSPPVRSTNSRPPPPVLRQAPAVDRPTTSTSIATRNGPTSTSSASEPSLAPRGILKLAYPPPTATDPRQGASSGQGQRPTPSASLPGTIVQPSTGAKDIPRRILDVSTLVHALPLVKEWVREGHYQLVVPLDGIVQQLSPLNHCAGSDSVGFCLHPRTHAPQRYPPLTFLRKLQPRWERKRGRPRDTWTDSSRETSPRR